MAADDPRSTILTRVIASILVLFLGACLLVSMSHTASAYDKVHTLDAQLAASLARVEDLLVEIALLKRPPPPPPPLPVPPPAPACVDPVLPAFPRSSQFPAYAPRS